MLSYGLNQHIPSSLNKTDIDAEFEQFYLGLLKDSKYPRREFINVENETTLYMRKIYKNKSSI